MSEMTSFKAISIAEGFADGEYTQEQQIEAWQYLIDTELVWSLQGWFGRTARVMIEEGLCTCKNINKME